MLAHGMQVRAHCSWLLLPLLFWTCAAPAARYLSTVGHPTTLRSDTESSAHLICHCAHQCASNCGRLHHEDQPAHEHIYKYMYIYTYTYMYIYGTNADCCCCGRKYCCARIPWWRLAWDNGSVGNTFEIVCPPRLPRKGTLHYMGIRMLQHSGTCCSRGQVAERKQTHSQLMVRLPLGLWRLTLQMKLANEPPCTQTPAIHCRPIVTAAAVSGACFLLFARHFLASL
jgi:hypothetical protein